MERSTVVDRGRKIDLAIGCLLGGYWRGLQDGRRRKGVEENPFPKGTQEYKGWFIGWEQFTEGQSRVD